MVDQFRTATSNGAGRAATTASSPTRARPALGLGSRARASRHSLRPIRGPYANRPPSPALDRPKEVSAAGSPPTTAFVGHRTNQIRRLDGLRPLRRAATSLRRS